MTQGAGERVRRDAGAIELGDMTSEVCELTDEGLRRLIMDSCARPGEEVTGAICDLCQGASASEVRGHIDHALDFCARRYTGHAEDWLLSIALGCASAEGGVDDEVFLRCLGSLQLQLVSAELAEVARAELRAGEDGEG